MPPTLPAAGITSISKTLRLVGRLTLLHRHISAWKEAAMDGESGLPATILETLYPLALEPPPGELGPTDLARRLGVTTATITNRLDRLEKSGLLVRRADARDRRAVRVALTEAGREAVAETVRALNEAVLPLADVLSNEERETLDKLLQKALAGLEKSAP